MTENNKKQFLEDIELRKVSGGIEEVEEPVKYTEPELSPTPNFNPGYIKYTSGGNSDSAPIAAPLTSPYRK